MHGEEDANVEAGWHVDPTGRHQLRYFNGTAWTGDVADDGNRGFDVLAPMGSQPVWTGSTGQDTGTPGAGLPVAGLILGIAGVACALSVMLFQVAALCGLLALVFGIVARRKARAARRPAPGMTTAAVVLGIVSMGLAAAAAALFYAVVQPLLDELERRAPLSAYDLTSPACGVADGRARYEAVLTNRDDDEQRFTVRVEFLDAASGERIGSGRAVLDDVRAGESAPVVITAAVDADTVLCQVDDVRIGRPPFG